MILAKGEYMQSSTYFFFVENFCWSCKLLVVTRNNLYHEDFSALIDMRRNKTGHIKSAPENI